MHSFVGPGKAHIDPAKKIPLFLQKLISIICLSFDVDMQFLFQCTNKCV